MPQKNDWDPGLYLKFKDERNRPSIDLADRIDIDYVPGSLIDIGCGPGNSGQALLHRWPASRLVGIDNSPGMIDQAKHDHPGQEWILADAHEYVSNKKFDVAFSNAAFQWLDDHEGLISKFSGFLTEKGVLAVQLPLFFDMPVGKSLEYLADKGTWKSLAGGCSGIFTMHYPGYYYDVLSGYFRSVDIWATDYIHILDSHCSIFEMIKSTGMRPYLERLETGDERITFEAAVLAEIQKDYPAQKNGKVLFPFKRLFFIGYK